MFRWICFMTQQLAGSPQTHVLVFLFLSLFSMFGFPSPTGAQVAVLAFSVPLGVPQGATLGPLLSASPPPTVDYVILPPAEPAEITRAPQFWTRANKQSPVVGVSWSAPLPSPPAPWSCFCCQPRYIHTLRTCLWRKTGVLHCLDARTFTKHNTSEAAFPDVSD